MFKQLASTFLRRIAARVSHRFSKQQRFCRLRLETLETRSLLATLINSGTATDAIYELPASANEVFLEDDGTTGNGLLRLRSANGAFDTTDFSSPTSSLTIKRGTVADTLTVGTLADLASSLTVGQSGGEFASTTVAGTLTLVTDKSFSAFASDTISLSTDTSDLTTSGAGGVSLNSLRNITLLAGSSITTTNGDISLSANEQSARTSGAFEGVLISEAELTTNGTGSIRVFGRGGDEAGTPFQHGINIISSTLRSTSFVPAAGRITILGMGVGGTQDADGVLIHHVDLQPSVIESVTGNITITGTGGLASTTFNRGVALLQQTQIRSLGTGPNAADILIDGIAHSGTDFNEGVDIGGPNTNLTTVDGRIQITGRSNAGTGQFNIGIRVRDGAQIVSSGKNDATSGIYLGGTGGFGTTTNQGIRIEDAGTLISSVDSHIQLNGDARATTGTFQDGIRVVDGADMSVTGAGHLWMFGTAAGGPSAGVALRLGGGSLSTVSVAGDVNNLIRGDRMIIDPANFQLTASAGAVSLAPTTVGTAINVGSTVNNTASTLELSAAELAQVTAGKLTIGSTTTAGPITVNAPFSDAPSLEFASTSSVTINQPIALAPDQSFRIINRSTISLPAATSQITTSGTGSITLETSRDIRLNAGAALQSEDGDITLQANWVGAPTAGDFRGIRIDAASITTTDAGNIRLSGRGGDDPATDLHVGVHILGVVAANDTGQIIIQGRGGAGTDDNNGVVVEFAAGQVLASKGTVSIDGTGGAGTAHNNRGVAILHGGQIRSINQGPLSGKIIINGTGGQGTDFNSGVDLFGDGSLISTLDGDVQITGEGGGQATGNGNYGIRVSTGAVVTTLPSSTASLSIVGKGGGNGAPDSNTNQGVRIVGPGAKIETWTSGAIYIEGTGGLATLPSNTFADGVRLKDEGQLISHGSGPLTLIGRAGTTDQTLGVGLRLAGNMTLEGPDNFFSLDSAILEPDTASIDASSTSLTIATGILGQELDLGSTTDATPNTLALSDAELDCIDAAALLFHASTALTISADITRLSPTNMRLQAASIDITTGSLSTAGGNLDLAGDIMTAPHPGTDIDLGDGTLRFVGLSLLTFAINGTDVDTQYDQLKIIGNADWRNAILVLTGTYHAAAGDGFTLVDNDGNDPGFGFFNNFPPGVFTIPSGDLAGAYLLDYVSGDGNDVVLTAIDPPLSFTYIPGGYSTADENPATRGPALEQVIPGWAYNIAAEPTPDPAQYPAFHVTNDNPSLFTASGQPKVSIDGTLTYTPQPNAHGQAAVTVVLQDSLGQKATGTLTIEITKPYKLHNAAEVGARNGLDVTGSTSTQPDGVIAAGDVLAVINYINARGSGRIPADAEHGPPYCDVNGDNSVAADDVIKLINYINSQTGNEAEAASTSPLTPYSHDAALLAWQADESLPLTARKRR